MEMFQLKYFYAVVTMGGIHKAAISLHISAPAVSKTISNLESELNCSLFDRKNRNLVLTAEGQHLLKRAEEILSLEERTRVELKGPSSVREVVLAGREIFLEHYGILISEIAKKKLPSTRFLFLQASGKEATASVEQGRSHIALTLQPPPSTWRTVILSEMRLVTCVGPDHDFYSAAKRGKVLHIKEILEYGFISPNTPFFGQRSESQSIDGWRDDIHPRTISYGAESLSVFRELLLQGKGLAYIPDFWAKKLGVAVLKIEGCSFQTKNKIYCSAKRATDYAWLDKLMLDIKSQTQCF